MNYNNTPLNTAGISKLGLPLDERMYTKTFYGLHHIIGIKVQAFLSIEAHVKNRYQMLFDKNIAPKNMEGEILPKVILLHSFLNHKHPPYCLRCGLLGVYLTNYAEQGLFQCDLRHKNVLPLNDFFIFTGSLNEIIDDCKTGAQYTQKLNTLIKIHKQHQQSRRRNEQSTQTECYTTVK
jgi:hypothetical protein